jgi:hypothetical protein
MAVIEILGTDSLSSSRITLNDNFTSLEDEISNLKGYLDPSALTLTGVTVSTSQLTVGSSVLGTSSATIGVATTISANLTLDASIIKSGISGTSSAGLTALPATLAHSTYFVDATAQIALAVSTIVGQEITLIAQVSGDIEATNVAGAASITLTQNGTLTLRSDGTSWYIIGSYGATIA